MGFGPVSALAFHNLQIQLELPNLVWPVLSLDAAFLMQLQKCLGQPFCRIQEHLAVSVPLSLFLLPRDSVFSALFLPRD